MNYVVKLKAPDAHCAVRDGETRFDVSFDKMRPRKSGPYEFSAFIGPDETGVFQLTFSPTEINIEPRYRLLKFPRKRGLQTHREMAAKIGVGLGSIRNHLDKLMAERFLQGLKTNRKLSDEGFHLLHDFWPDEFSYAEQSKFFQRIDIPFEQACPPNCPETGHWVDNPTKLPVCGCSTWTTIWTTVFSVHPLKGVDTEQTEHGVVEIEIRRT